MANENDADFKGIMTLLNATSMFIIMVHLYFYCYNSLEGWGFTYSYVDMFLVKLNKQTGVFSNSLYSKMAALLFLAVCSFGNKPRKSLGMTWNKVYKYLGIGLVLFFGNILILHLGLPIDLINIIYISTTIAGYLYLMRAGSAANQIINYNPEADPFNDEKEQFQHETELKENFSSINIPIEYRYKNKTQLGWVNVINPFRASMVLGTPGSGKTFSVILNFIRQHIEKGFCMYIYDFKFSDSKSLSKVAYNYLMANQDKYRNSKYYNGKVPQFYTVNFDNLRISSRCNPLMPQLMTSIADGIESAITILTNMNKSWAKKEGEFFVETPMNFLASVIWFLKLYDDRRLQEMGDKHDGYYFCTFPHVVEFTMGANDEIFPILSSEPEIENLMVPFSDALAKGAFEQLAGQVASTTTGLGRMTSPEMYWVMTGNDMNLDINNPNEPKIICVGNNPDRQKLYSTALGLFNARLVKMVNKPNQAPSSLIVDELPTIYFTGLDNLIATGRSNEVSVCLGLQDLSQLIRDYSKEIATAIFNTIGNVFAGQVKGETAKTLSTSFGKNRQQSISISENAKDTSFSISDRMEIMIPESKISNLSQGEMVGSLADNFGEKTTYKIFKGKMMVGADMIKFMKELKEIPPIKGLEVSNVSDQELNAAVRANFFKVKSDVKDLIKSELARIANDPALQHFLPAEKLEEYLIR